MIGLIILKLRRDVIAKACQDQTKYFTFMYGIVRTVDMTRDVRGLLALRFCLDMVYVTAL
jgi:hypothetical protein